MDFLLNYGVEWLNLLVRWLHVVAGIAWIGASFYFVWLDNALRAPRPGSDLEKKGVAGELWAIHGGGFYNPQKYLVAPRHLPDELHWFKWEAYTTWLSGFALLVIVYYLNASSMMIDNSVAALSTGQAVGIGVASLVVAWVVYDLLCKSPLGRHDLWFGLVIFTVLVLAAWGLSKLLGGRAAYIHVGAMIGTIMAANVLMQIIPAQRKMVEAMKAGNMPDPEYGLRGKQRSVHNNYFTLPILFIMISNHYAMTWSHPYNWLILAGIMAAGALIRHFFNLRHKGRVEWRYPLAGLALLALVAIGIAPRPRAPVGAERAVDTGAVQAVVEQRCVGCHSSRPTHPGFAAAPSGVMLDTQELLRQHAANIYRQAVQLKSMPVGNVTGMTDQERELLARWYESLGPR